MEKLFWLAAVASFVSGLLAGCVTGWAVARPPERLARVRRQMLRLGRRGER